jgi:hypothetical protein
VPDLSKPIAADTSESRKLELRSGHEISLYITVIYRVVQVVRGVVCVRCRLLKNNTGHSTGTGVFYAYVRGA